MPPPGTPQVGARFASKGARVKGAKVISSDAFVSNRDNPEECSTPEKRRSRKSVAMSANRTSGPG
jgi:hypothetical protein